MAARTTDTEPFRIRDATEADLPAINDIYNHYVLTSSATYQYKPESIESRRDWFLRHGAAHPVIVAEIGGIVIAWAALSPFHPRAAYRHTVESSVYVHGDWHRRGLGRALTTDLIARARKIGHHSLIALIDGEQTASLGMHQSLGFVRAGHLHQVGHKFGRWLDVIFAQLTL